MRAIVFGAFDRHNLGDLLLAHVVSALWRDGPVLHAGLLRRDLRHLGGHVVEPLPEVMGRTRDDATVLIHAGGETLTCPAWEAAVMLQPPQGIQATIAYLEARPAEQPRWRREILGTDALAPYVVSRADVPGAAQVVFHAVGGVDLAACAPALQAEVLAKLAAADDVSVRDAQTLAHLGAAGIAADLVPDPAVMVAELFGPRIRKAMADDALARLPPQGHIAVQFSGDFADDATLTRLAAQFDRLVEASGCAVVFFRAGAAPWHDDVELYHRTVSRMRTGAALVMPSLDIWTLCALIASSRAYCGSSLHGRIVATAFGVPRVNLIRPADLGRPTKQAAFATTWDTPAMPGTVVPGDVADALVRALALGSELLRQTAAGLAQRYRAGFEAMCRRVAARLLEQ